ncbi:MAG: hypothetical protein OXE42_14420 [Gammaproteobacteria bacterium]|nr:hypothetical protein [Gammaproteobacteria bacterium]
MPSVSNPAPTVVTPPVARDSQPDSRVSTAPAGATHDGRQVRAGGAQSPVAPALAGAGPAPSDSPARTVAAADGEAVNQPGELRRPGLQLASRLRRLAQYIREGIGNLVARVTQRGNRDAGGGVAGAPAAGGPQAAPAAGAGEQQVRLDPETVAMCAEAISAGKRNFAEQAAGQQHSLEQVQSMFLANREGLGRALNSLDTLGSHRPPRDIVKAWGPQVEQISKLARRVGDAHFSAAVPAGFMQYGSRGESNPYHAALTGEHAQLEPQVRAWVGQGLELAEQLAALYYRACPTHPEPQAPFAAGKGELTALQKRVSDFERGGDPTMEQELNRRLDEANREPGAEEFQGWTEAQLLERELARNQVFAEEREIPAAAAESAAAGTAQAAQDGRQATAGKDSGPGQGTEGPREPQPITGRETAV